jgi:glucosamine kinase
MLLVVESGSTKADWLLVENGNERLFVTIGFNPYFLSKEDILNELNKNEGLASIKDAEMSIFFYGAGCANTELNSKIETSLLRFFKHSTVQVNNDLKAAALACYNGTPAITCILGTGSNSCYFDGKKLTQASPSIGYILGDEGSGNYFGKRMLSDFLYKRLPKVMTEELTNEGLDKEVILNHVYLKPKANLYIASFMPILIRNKQLDYCQILIREGFRKFIDIHVKCYADFRDVEVNFVGSIAFHLKEELRAVCSEEEIVLGSVIQKPIQNLVRYHLSETKTS